MEERWYVDALFAALTRPASQAGELNFSCARTIDAQAETADVQGMNVLAAPFLYTLPSELEAFHCFSRFIEHSAPLYVQPTLEGVHRGLRVRASSSPG